MLGWIANSIAFISTMIMACGYPNIGFPVLILGNACLMLFGIMTKQFSFFVSPFYPFMEHGDGINDSSIY